MASTEGLRDHLATELVEREDGGVIGSAALECYGTVALLRTVAVVAAQRGQGLGKRLTRTALDLAQAQGTTEVYPASGSGAGLLPPFRVPCDPSPGDNTSSTAFCRVDERLSGDGAGHDDHASPMRMLKTMRQADYPLLEFDATLKAVLEPTLLFPLLRVPEHAFAYLSSVQDVDKREQRNQYRHHDICHAHIRINFTSHWASPTTILSRDEWIAGRGK